MRYRFYKIICSSAVLAILICNINIYNNFADQNDVVPPTQMGDSGKDDLHLSENVVIPEDIKDYYMEYLHVSENLSEMLITIRNVIAKNQELINRDPVTGNYVFKDFVPAIVGTQVANDFSLKTGYRIKQTSLKVRNLNNEPDEWEKKVLNFFESDSYTKNGGYSEITQKNGKQSFRYMKPIFVEIACLQCHGRKTEIKPAIMQFLNRRYPFDNAFGYKEGDVRGGISIVIPITTR